MSDSEGLVPRPSPEVLEVVEKGNRELVAERAQLNALKVGTDLLIDAGIRFPRGRSHAFTTDDVSVGAARVNVEGEIAFREVGRARRPAAATMDVIAVYPDTGNLPDGGTKTLFSLSGRFNEAGDPIFAQTTIGEKKLTNPEDIIRRAEVVVFVDQAVRQVRKNPGIFK